MCSQYLFTDIRIEHNRFQTVWGFLYFTFEKKNLSLLLFLKKLEKKEFKKVFFEREIKNFSDTEDILIIGNIYKSFSKNQKKNLNTFYFPLIQQQYLCSMEKEK